MVRQTSVLFRYWVRGEKGRVFLRHTLQDALLVSTIFFTTTIFRNINVVFGQLTQVLLLDSGGSNSGSFQVQQVDPSKVDWSQSSAILSSLLSNHGLSAALATQIDAGTFYASIIILGYLILRDSWGSFNRSRLSFSFYRPAMRGVLYHGCDRRSVFRFVFLTSTIQAVVSYVGGVALTVFVIVPLLSHLLSGTFFVFLISGLPTIAYAVVLLPVLATFVLNVTYFRRKVIGNELALS